MAVESEYVGGAGAGEGQMTMQDFNELYGSVVMPGACVSVPTSWLPAIHEAMAAIAALPSEIRAFVMVMAILEDQGQLVFEVVALPGAMPDDGVQRLRAIIETAQRACRQRVH